MQKIASGNTPTTRNTAAKRHSSGKASANSIQETYTILIVWTSEECAKGHVVFEAHAQESGIRNRTPRLMRWNLDT
jgi:hypothetical protein